MAKKRKSKKHKVKSSRRFGWFTDGYGCVNMGAGDWANMRGAVRDRIIKYIDDSGLQSHDVPELRGTNYKLSRRCSPQNRYNNNIDTITLEFKNGSMYDSMRRMQHFVNEVIGGDGNLVKACRPASQQNFTECDVNAVAALRELLADHHHERAHTKMLKRAKKRNRR